MRASAGRRYHTLLSNEEVFETLKAFTRLRGIVHEILLLNPEYAVDDLVAANIDLRLEPGCKQHTTRGLILRVDRLPVWVATPYGDVHFSGGYYPQGRDFSRAIVRQLRSEGVALEAMSQLSTSSEVHYYAVSAVQDLRLLPPEPGSCSYLFHSHGVDDFHDALSHRE